MAQLQRVYCHLFASPVNKMKPFHLSIVATTRNDNHGGSLTYRMQHFVDGFVAQCIKHDLRAELILVEWNPPENAPPLSQELRFPSQKGPCAIRIIRVPGELHRKFQHSEKIPLFQMIGKNVGIRRALGEFVLCTNIDILFSDNIITFMRDQLKTGLLYRVDRLDVPPNLPKTNFDEVLKFCHRTYFRINGKYGTRIRGSRNWLDVFNYFKKWKCVIGDRKFVISVENWLSLFRCFKKWRCVFTPSKCFRKIMQKGLYIFRKNLQQATYILKKITQQVIYLLRKIKRRALYHLHTNACGDFSLLSYRDWSTLKGYPEWAMFSWHIDSVALYHAKHVGIKEIDLPRNRPIYHIEHGSGYTPEGAKNLFQRLEDQGVPYLTNTDFLNIASTLSNSKERIVYNSDDWGLGDQSLEEIWV